MELTLSAFAVSPQELKPGSSFAVSVTAKNTIGRLATLAELQGMIEVDLNDGSEFPTLITVYSGSVEVSWANNATKNMTFSGVINDSVWNELNAIIKSHPDANVRTNNIQWSFGLFENSMSNEFAYGYAEDGLLYDATYAPTIENFIVERGIDGAPNDEGESLLSTIKLGVAERYHLKYLSLKLYYSDSGVATNESEFVDLTSHIPDLLSGVIDSADLIANTFSNTSNWHFLLVFGDAYESVSAAVSIPRAFANMHLSGKTTGGVAFGGFSTSEEGNPKAEFHYRIYPYAGIEGLGITYPQPNETPTDPGEEQLTGDYWIDGKPIYRRTIKGYLGVTSDINFGNIGPCESVIKMYGFAKFHTQPWRFAVNTYASSGAEFACWIEDSAGTVRGHVKPAKADVWVVIEYTKPD